MQLVLLSGGSGKRLWPLSNNARSKQFLPLLVFGKSPINDYFLKAINTDHPYFSLQELYIRENNTFVKRLEPLLLATGWSLSEINELKETASPSHLFFTIKHFYVKPIVRKMQRLFTNA